MNKRRISATALCLALATPACTGSGGSVIHRVADGSPTTPEAVVSVSEVDWEWSPGEGERVSKVHAGPVGAVIELTDGLVGPRGDTGDELWRYQAPEAEGFSASFSPSGELALVSASDEPALLLDTSTGEAASWDLDWNGEGRLLDGEFLFHREGEATEALHESTDLETGAPLWRQKESVTCSEGGPSRTITTLLSPKAIILLLHCSEDTSEGALRVPAPDTVNALVALDPKDGGELWRREAEDTEGRGLAGAKLLQGHLVADLPGEEGWTIIDPIDGEVLTESPKPVLEIGDDTYLASPNPLAEDPSHELRTFDGEMISSVTLPDGHFSGDTPETAIGLPDHLLTIDMERGSDEDAIDVVVTPWGDEGAEDVIAATTTATASSLDPGRLLSVPGAVIAYVPVQYGAGIDAIEGVVALR
ncbi:dehydrogenase [Nocardiopsis alba]|uniref:Dehydrogenase n=1 Tax=Nocardiopsis alba TaxID=53437 RepID=A0ABV5E158_9ACTN